MAELGNYKIVFVGDQAAGKTSIITCFMYGNFDTNYQGSCWAREISKPSTKLYQRFICDTQSFINTSKWIEEVRAERGSHVIIVVGNKTDLVNKRQVSIEEGDDKAREIGALFMETSAKVGFNIKPLFCKIASALQGIERVSWTKQEDLVDVNLKPLANSSQAEH